MKPPRISLGSIAMAILILAINFAFIRQIFDPGPQGSWKTHVFFLLPSLNVLFVRFYKSRKRGYLSAGAVGFLFAGLTATVLVFVACVVAPEAMFDPLGAIGRPIAQATMKNAAPLLAEPGMLASMVHLALGITFEIFLPMAYLSIPPLRTALLGGWAAERFSTRRGFGWPAPEA
jgi:hypothetical protein